jgi:hypothetical protein
MSAEPCSGGARSRARRAPRRALPRPAARLRGRRAAAVPAHAGPPLKPNGGEDRRRRPRVNASTSAREPIRASPAAGVTPTAHERLTPPKRAPAARGETDDDVPQGTRPAFVLCSSTSASHPDGRGQGVNSRARDGVALALRVSGGASSQDERGTKFPGQVRPRRESPRGPVRSTANSGNGRELTRMCQ